MLTTVFQTITLLHHCICHHYLIIPINPFSVFLLSFMKDTEWRECRDRFYIKDSNYARFPWLRRKQSISVAFSWGNGRKSSESHVRKCSPARRLPEWLRKFPLAPLCFRFWNVEWFLALLSISKLILNVKQS